MKRMSVALLAGVSVMAFAPAVAQAQQQPAAASQEAAADDSAPQQEIIVTGTSRSRVALDTPLAVSAVGAEALSRAGASSQADILNTIPTIKADGGGGEVAANIFVKGLPSGGQYQFTPLMYDGIPALSSFGLNSSAYDVYERNDLGIARLEFVRGGVSNLFGPGSVAGLINYISKTGHDQLEGTVQLEVAEKDRYRGDIALSGPLGNNLYFAVSGFYRSDKGPVRTNLDTKGGQLRGNLEYRFADGSGNIKVLGQYIDDRVQFFLPIPLSGSTRERLAGNDGQLVNSVQNNFGPGLGLFDGCVYAALHDVMPNEARATAAGLMTMCGFLGAGISTVVLPAIAAHTGLAAGFAMMAALYLAAVAILIGGRAVFDAAIGRMNEARQGPLP